MANIWPHAISALDLSASTVDTSMITVSSCGVKLQEVLGLEKHWARCCELMKNVAYSNIFQTPKAQIFSECQVPIAWTTNIHLQEDTTCVLVLRSYSTLGNTKVSLHISTVH